MKTFIHRPVERPVSLELEVRYMVTRADGACKQFEALTPEDKRSPIYTWGFGNQHAGGNLVLVPVDPWTAIKLGMVTFEELQLPEGARALINMI